MSTAAWGLDVAVTKSTAVTTSAVLEEDGGASHDPRAER
jgi:hypothetical protein